MKSIAETSIWSGWSLDRKTAIELAAHLRHTRPSNILECGSGYSTVVLAEYARDTGARVTTLEHDPLWMSQTRGILIAQGLAEYVDLRIAPLTQVELPNGNLAYWYNTKMPDTIDFALIDGPPGRYGRNAAMHAIRPNLASKWEAWLDDAHRPDEQSALTDWLTSYGISHKIVNLPHGLAIMGVDDQPINASGLTITILVKNQARQLASMLSSVLSGAPGLLETAHVIVAHNNEDSAIFQLLEGVRSINKIISVRSLGSAMGLIASTIGNDGLWMHLDDNWSYATTQPVSMIMDNVRSIMEDPRIGQIRLRHLGELAKPAHNEQPIDWTEPVAYQHRVGAAPYTLDPSIMRAKDAKNIWWPEASEHEAMERFSATGSLTARLIPGAFHHQSTESLEGHLRPVRYRRGLACR